MLTADKMQRAFKPVVTDTLEGNNWHKLTEPSVDRGRTTFPRKPADQERLGVRFDYDGEDTGIGGTVYHKYQIQVNAGDKIPRPSRLGGRTMVALMPSWGTYT